MAAAGHPRNPAAWLKALGVVILLAVAGVLVEMVVGVNRYSDFGAQVDHTFWMIVLIAALLLGGIVVFMVYCLVVYRHDRVEVPVQVEGNWWLEFWWTVIPVVIVLGMFWAGYEGFRNMRTVPKNAMKVKVLARMWSWEFEYENGVHSNVLKVPVGTPVRLTLTSADVIHSFYIPHFRVKEDCVPGREGYMWFKADEVDTYTVMCAEYCGDGHAKMMTNVVSLPREAFEEWLRSAAEEKKAMEEPVAEELSPEEKERKMAAAGEKLYNVKGCAACHSVDGSPRLGPSFKGIYGKKVRVMTGGKAREVLVDDAYLTKSMKTPTADVVEGFQPVMPPQNLTDAEIEKINTFIKSLK
ncbi:MAG: cytochrome c oxidase subunit II [Candidatus Hydrogenedentota bacterium]|nr:MAG: cytochrome c oxidase subunit II [Candidatus Hydrogenedentota bacterium]